MDEERAATDAEIAAYTGNDPFTLALIARVRRDQGSIRQIYQELKTTTPLFQSWNIPPPGNSGDGYIAAVRDIVGKIPGWEQMICS